MRYWLSSGQTLAAVSADLGVSPECLRSWRKQMESATASTVEATDAAVPSSTGDLALAREVGQLRRELEAMTRQRDILNGAISIFSDDKSLNPLNGNGGLK